MEAEGLDAGFTAQRRTKDDIADEVHQILQDYPVLLELDFDGPVKQCLHAIHTVGGRHAVREALHSVGDCAKRNEARGQVRKWPAYVQALLKRFLREFMAETRGSAVSEASWGSAEDGAAGPADAPGAERDPPEPPWWVPEAEGQELMVAAAAAVAATTCMRGAAARLGRSALEVAKAASGRRPDGGAERGTAATRNVAAGLGEAAARESVMAHQRDGNTDGASGNSKGGHRGISIATVKMPGRAGKNTRSLQLAPSTAQDAAPWDFSQTELLCCFARHWPCSGEVFLEQLLDAMYRDMQQIRRLQQQLVDAAECACRKALGPDFCRLELVGSAALCIETPGSDIDVVCFARSEEQEAVPCAHSEQLCRARDLEVLQRIHRAFEHMAGEHFENTKALSMSLHVARVPILQVLWGLPGGPIALDISINQARPVEHVRWFQQIMAAQAPAPRSGMRAVSTFVTIARCVKWWLRQRRIPRYKEGGLPTLVWLLLALHASTGQAVDKAAPQKELRPTIAILAGLAAFFQGYAAAGSLHGSLQFTADPVSSEFKPGARSEASPWARLSVPDPTLEGADLARELPPATQLLLAHELRRASARLTLGPPAACRRLREVFEPVSEDANTLPACLTESIGALVLLGSPSAGVGSIEVVVIQCIIPREGWQAPFLHRADTSSELHVQLLSIEDRTGRWELRQRGSVLLCPCHFVCRVNLGDDPRRHELDAEALERLKGMRGYLEELRAALPRQRPSRHPQPRQQHRRQGQGRALS